MTVADRGRADVYAAELTAYEGTDLEVVVAFEELVVEADELTSQQWWPRGPVPVRRSRSDARSSATRQSARTVVNLAPPQMTRATLVHELAHVLAGVESGHGELFRRAHVDLAMQAFGVTRGGWLATAYAAADLPLATRRWPPPPMPMSGVSAFTSARSGQSSDAQRSAGLGPIALRRSR